MATPDAFEPVRAWRVWIAARHAGAHRLQSVVHRYVWVPGEAVVARCLTSAGTTGMQHDAPERTCRCGVYGVASVDVLRRYLGFPYVRDSRPRVLGLVSLWGDVIECDKGWRASRAYPERIWVPAAEDGTPCAPIALDLADYGVPIELVDESSAQEALSALWPATAKP